MVRVLIAYGYIPDNPTTRFLAEWIELTGCIYITQEGFEQQPPLNRAAGGSAAWIAYDTWVKKMLHHKRGL